MLNEKCYLKNWILYKIYCCQTRYKYTVSIYVKLIGYFHVNPCIFFKFIFFAYDGSSAHYLPPKETHLLIPTGRPVAVVVDSYYILIFFILILLSKNSIYSARVLFSFPPRQLLQRPRVLARSICAMSIE